MNDNRTKRFFMRNVFREIGSEFDLNSNKDLLNMNIKNVFLRNSESFRSGRDALKAIALNYKGSYKRVLLPALCCESMVKPFQINGYEILYYQMNNDLTANSEDIYSKLEGMSIFLYMNYFGIHSLSKSNLELVKNKFSDIIIIEDKTHDVLTLRANQLEADYTVFSIRKWLAVPDGGILYTKAQLFNEKKQDSFFCDTRVKALKNKAEYLKYGNHLLKELFREQFAEAEEYLSQDNNVVGMSSNTYQILEHYDFEKTAKLRNRNISILSERLKDTDAIKHLHSSCYEQTILYYPILINDRDGVQDTLASKGIYCPVIWPLPEGAKGICPVSDYISSNMLALPCDQRYDPSDMDYIAENLKKAVGA